MRLSIKIFSALLCALFFFPWVSTFNIREDILSFPAVPMLLILPASLLVLAFTKVPYRHLLKISLVNILGLAWFNTHFAHSLEYRGDSNVTLFYWAAVAVNTVIIFITFVGIKSNGEFKHPVNISPPYSDVQKIIISGVFLGIAFSVSLLTTIVIPIGGAPILRIGFSGVFHNIIAVFFGPVFGGIQRTMADLLNFFLNPRITGVFLLPVTMVAFFRGFTIGYVWLKVKNINPKIFSIFYSTAFGLLMLLGIANALVLHLFPYSAYGAWLTPLNPNGTPNIMVRNVLSYGLIIAGLLGLVPQTLAYTLTRKTGNEQFYNRFIKLLISIVLPGIIANAINTYILMLTVIGPMTRELGFVYFWIPRFFEEITTSLLAVYLMVVLLEVYEKAMRRKLV
ncbi:MAG: ECF transporter S component [Defluviitaleaceae bacterium]|nr:ECF transporter S component [Defluviitaleaceae bacterium]